MKTKQLILCAMFTALIAVGAFLKIPVPFVPITMQVLFVILGGVLLGGKLGGISALMYMIIGLIGIPIFTQGGGIGYIFQPTFGYIIGFVFGAYVTGKIANSVPNPDFKRVLMASVVGVLVIYAFGMVYYYGISHLYLHTNIGVRELFLYLFVMVIPGDLISCLICALASVRVLPIINKRTYVNNF